MPPWAETPAIAHAKFTALSPSGAVGPDAAGAVVVAVGVPAMPGSSACVRMTPARAVIPRQPISLRGPGDQISGARRQKPELVPLDRLAEQFDFTSPRWKGRNTVETCEGILDGHIHAFKSIPIPGGSTGCLPTGVR